jgi:ribonuclease PH
VELVDGVTNQGAAEPKRKPPKDHETAACVERRQSAKSALDGISGSLPALAASQEMQERAANLGYDWPSIDGILDKVVEETQELREATTNTHWAEEFGDLLFVLVNVARRQGVEAEAAMRAANAKFRRRFGSVERQAAAQGVAADLFRRTRYPVGQRQGTGKDVMTIGNRPSGREPGSERSGGRGPREMRPVSFKLDVQKWAEGSCVIRVGDTEVLCAATIADRVPPHLRGKGTGWVTAEYSMLPRATKERSDRESARGKIGGRTHEIQRLIGRSLRGVVDLARLGERRSPSIARSRPMAAPGPRDHRRTWRWRRLIRWHGAPPRGQGGCRSASTGRGASTSTTRGPGEVDFNVVGTDAGRYVELQGTAEGKAFSREDLATLLDLAGVGLGRLFEAQAAALATVPR